MLAGVRRYWHTRLPRLKESLARFPLPLGCAALFTVTLMGFTHNVTFLTSETASERILLFTFVGFFLFLAIHLVAEAQAWKASRVWPLTAALGLLLAAQVVWGTPEVFWLNATQLLLAPAGILAVMAAPFILAPGANAAFWHFNREVWFGAAFGLLFALVLAGGLTAAYGAMDLLFGLHVADDIYADTWILALGLVWPWLALAGVPRAFAAPKEPYAPKHVAFMANTVLVPLAVAYLAIIYAYMAKLAIQWSLPDGEVAPLVLGYAGFGVAVHLIAFPFRDSGNRLLRLIHRAFYPALIAPAALLAQAIGVRVEAYGVTEPRYLVMVAAAWFLGIAVAFSLRPRTGLRIVPLSLAILLTLGAVGPWGAGAVSERNQVARLERLLLDHGLLENGLVVEAKTPVPRNEVARISSIISYLYDSGKLPALAPWFANTALDLESEPYPKDVVATLGLDYTLNPDDPSRFHFRQASGTKFFGIQGYDLLARARLSVHRGRWRTMLTAPETGGEYRAHFDQTTGLLRITDPAGAQVVWDLNAFALDLRQQSIPTMAANLRLGSADGGLRGLLIFESLSGEIDNGRPRVTYADMLILVGSDEAP